MLRDFILGQSQLGLVVTSSNGTVSVIGGEDPKLAGDALVGQAGMYVGDGFGDNITTTGTYYWPTASVAAWESFIATATVIPGRANAQTDAPDSENAARAVAVSVSVAVAGAAFVVSLLALA